MGWNSYDYYDTAVTEADVRRNAEVMHDRLRRFGYEYVVTDISWYVKHAAALALFRRNSVSPSYSHYHSSARDPACRPFDLQADLHYGIVGSFKKRQRAD